ncbi:MAG: hypothetical protein AB1733_21880 [Thermodesulfobacteriota bacterium]
METLQPGDQVVELSPNGERVEVLTVEKVLADGVQTTGASGKLSTASLRHYDESIVQQIREKENEIKLLKRALLSLYDKLDKLA